MKKIVIMILSAVCVFATLSFVACGKGNKNETKFETKLSFKTLTVDGTNVYGKVSNNTETFSFVNEIEYLGSIKYFVSFDIYGNQKINTKTISLNVGDNTVYITELLGDEPKATYEVTIHRRPMYTVSFNTSNGTKISNQQIEEDSCATMPETPERRGYTFDKWNYDFTRPIIKNTTINANWKTITYNIYYNLNGGIMEGENPTTYTVEDEITLILPHKTAYVGSWNDNGKIAKGSIGDKTFSATYTPRVYKIIYNCGKGTNNSRNPLKYTIESDTIVLNDAYYINAEFIEWRQNGVKVTEIKKDSIGDVTLTAVWDEYDVMLQENGNGYTVIGLNCNKTDIVIKSTYKGKKVTAIGDNAFKNCSQITSITIPDGVTSIGDYAFYGCNGLLDITVPNSVVSIGDYAFYGCNRLTDITIPNSVTSIDFFAFNGCSSLESITLPFIGAKTASKGYDQVFGYIFGYTTTSNNSSISGATYQYRIYDSNSYKYYYYYIPSSLKKVILSDRATSVGDYAFYGCSGLTSVVIPNSVTSIGYESFYGCSGLASVVILNSVISTSIGGRAFKNCSGLTNITIGNGVTSIGYDAFNGCSSLERITLPFIGASKTASNGYDQVFGYIFGYTTTSNNSSISGATYQYRIYDSNSYKYYHYYIPSSLKTIILSDSVTSISPSAFV